MADLQTPACLRCGAILDGDVCQRCLGAFRNKHAGQPIIVCGLGPSIPLLTEPHRWITLGLNAIDQHFAPTYCLALDPMPRWWEIITNSAARAVFLGCRSRHEIYHPRAVVLEPEMLGADIEAEFEATATAGIRLTAFMGARPVGLVGVDFYAPNNRYRQWYFSDSRPQRDAHFAVFAEEMRARQVEIFNLSPESRLMAFPKIGLAEFTERFATHEANND